MLRTYLYQLSVTMRLIITPRLRRPPDALGGLQGGGIKLNFIEKWYSLRFSLSICFHKFVVRTLVLIFRQE